MNKQFEIRQGDLVRFKTFDDYRATFNSGLLFSFAQRLIKGTSHFKVLHIPIPGWFGPDVTMYAIIATPDGITSHRVPLSRLVKVEPEEAPPATPIPSSGWLADIADIVAQITYKPGWKVLLSAYGERPYLQVHVSDQAEASMDSIWPHKRTAWKGGKRYVSKHMCRQEIVGLCFDMIKAAEMHEIHEWFRYKNASIFNPHLDPDVLAEVARKKTSFNVRTNAMTMVEVG